MHWTFLLGLCLWASGIAEARQIRINRYAATVQEDELQQADVKQLRATPTPTPTPYPASGYRPEGRAFWLPGENEAEGSGGAAVDQLTTTTELPLDDGATSTTESLELSTTTTLSTPTTTTLDELDAVTTTTATPLVKFRSGRAFERAPYPAAGYRPSRAFLLPTELGQQQLGAAKDEAEPETAPASNANHPVCGVSTNPLMPTPEPGSKDEPDAESVVITGNLGPAVIVASAPSSNGIPVAIPYRSRPLIQAPRRGFVYTTHVEQRW